MIFLVMRANGISDDEQRLMAKKNTTKNINIFEGKPVPRFDDLPDMLTPEEARIFLRLSRNAMYSAVKDLPHITVGRLIRIPKSALMGSQ